MMKLLRWSVLIVCMAFANAHAAPILLVDGTGKLAGATGVDVEGTLHDVAFLDGTCISVFTGCNEAGDFTFQTAAGAAAASQALLDQVLLDVGSILFDSSPDLTVGCSDPFQCRVFTPWRAPDLFGPFPVSADVGFANNSFIPGQDFTGATLRNIFVDTSTVASSGRLQTWAVWSPSPSAAPEPGTIAILGVGLLALVLTRRRRIQTRDRTQ